MHGYTVKKGIKEDIQFAFKAVIFMDLVVTTVFLNLVNVLSLINIPFLVFFYEKGVRFNQNRF